VDARSAAEAVLTKVADAELLAQTRQLADTDDYVWVWDPDVSFVAGLVRRSAQRRALVVVYVADEDFEHDDEALADAVEAVTVSKGHKPMAPGVARHEFETEGRQDQRTVTPCAICGESRSSLLHRAPPGRLT